jgi:hypothetical protein
MLKYWQAQTQTYFEYKMRLIINDPANRYGNPSSTYSKMTPFKAFSNKQKNIFMLTLYDTNVLPFICHVGKLYQNYKTYENNKN